MRHGMSCARVASTRVNRAVPEVSAAKKKSNGAMRTGDEQVCAYIALGSNLNDPVLQITRAFVALDAMPKTRCVLKSSLYSSQPMGEIEQADYINAVTTLETCLSPRDLLRCLQDIENRQGRVRGDVRWGPRTLDLDILMYADLQHDDPVLTLPHPGLSQRNFVLFPLLEIAPGLTVPGLGSLQGLVNKASMMGLQRLETEHEMPVS